jgi:hypothetical protein
MEMVTTKVSDVLDKVKEQISANDPAKPGSGKDTYEMYRPSYAQTLHSLLKVSILDKIS